MMPEVRHVKSEEHYEVVVKMTPDEYKVISNNAAWGGDGSVSRYLVDCALGRQRRGC
jgi:hypothetical protein